MTPGVPVMLRGVAAMSGMLACLACDAAPSETVNAFLQATQAGDLGVLAKVSVVGWPGQPAVRVEASDIEAWWITEVETSQVEPFQLDEWQERLNAARARRDEELREKGGDAELARIQSRVDRLRLRVEREREQARKSVKTWTPIDGLQGDVEVRRVELVVRSPSGDHHCALTLKRYRLSNSSEQRPAIPSRWIVTAIEAIEA